MFSKFHGQRLALQIVLYLCKEIFLTFYQIIHSNAYMDPISAYFPKHKKALSSLILSKEKSRLRLRRTISLR